MKDLETEAGMTKGAARRLRCSSRLWRYVRHPEEKGIKKCKEVRLTEIWSSGNKKKRTRTQKNSLRIHLHIQKFKWNKLGMFSSLGFSHFAVRLRHNSQTCWFSSAVWAVAGSECAGMEECKQRMFWPQLCMFRLKWLQISWRSRTIAVAQSEHNAFSRDQMSFTAEGWYKECVYVLRALSTSLVGKTAARLCW